MVYWRLLCIKETKMFLAHKSRVVWRLWRIGWLKFGLQISQRTRLFQVRLFLFRKNLIHTITYCNKWFTWYQCVATLQKYSFIDGYFHRIKKDEEGYANNYWDGEPLAGERCRWYHCSELVHDRPTWLSSWPTTGTFAWRKAGRIIQTGTLF